MKVRLLLLAIVLLVLAGCTTGGSGSSYDVDYRTGSQALELKLLTPGLEDFYEGDQMILLVEYFNRGVHDIVNGQFYVSGFDEKFLRIQTDPAFIAIEGKSEYDPRGDNSQILTLRSTGVRLPVNSEEFAQTIKLTACYDYTTEASAEICVDPDPNGRSVTRKVCTMGPVSPGPQGSPIVITRVEPVVSKNDFRLNIEFANQGSGVVYDSRISNDKCAYDLDRYQDLDKVDITRIDFSGRGMNCNPSNPIRLINGKGKVTCECKGCINEYSDAYNTQVAIEFSYGYRNEVLKQVRVLSDD
jgi:hypothetical protein